ncbi:hypothetical protein AVEN_47582-1 [Araneus ventricosus]|uniref:Uncharacterized protein n=1 Tax=Araneus ventricosus TaxID=182803 RepID=A0A4Y2DNG9_ARAVE|nr:hypothetical protein AVEN_47582-1 [Araneus ventricosus]
MILIAIFTYLDNKLSLTSGLLPRRVPSVVSGTNGAPFNPAVSIGGPRAPRGTPVAFALPKCAASNVAVAPNTVVAPPTVADVNRYMQVTFAALTFCSCLDSYCFCFD